MPPTRLILVAHAATAATRRAAFASGDEPVEASSLPASSLRRGRWATANQCLTSPAAAARGTAEALGLAAASCPALRDLDAGRWVGRALSEIAPDEIAAWLSNPDYADHGGESLAALVGRMAELLNARLVDRGTTVAVTHAATVRAALVAALQAPAPAFWRIDVMPLDALVLVSNGRRWALRGLGPLGIDAA